MGTQLPGSSAEDGRSPVLTFRGVSRPAALRSWGSWSPPRMGLSAEVLPLAYLTLAKASAILFCPERSDLGPAGIRQSVLTCASRQGPPTPLRSRQETDTVVEASELPTSSPWTTHPCSEQCMAHLTLSAPGTLRTTEKCPHHLSGVPSKAKLQPPTAGSGTPVP